MNLFHCAALEQYNLPQQQRKALMASFYAEFQLRALSTLRAQAVVANLHSSGSDSNIGIGPNSLFTSSPFQFVMNANNKIYVFNENKELQ